MVVVHKSREPLCGGLTRGLIFRSWSPSCFLRLGAAEPSVQGGQEVKGGGGGREKEAFTIKAVCETDPLCSVFLSPLYEPMNYAR